MIIGVATALCLHLLVCGHCVIVYSHLLASTCFAYPERLALTCPHVLVRLKLCVFAREPISLMSFSCCLACCVVLCCLLLIGLLAVPFWCAHLLPAARAGRLGDQTRPSYPRSCSLLQPGLGNREDRRRAYRLGDDLHLAWPI